MIAGRTSCTCPISDGPAEFLADNASDFVEVCGPTAQIEKTLSHLWLRDRPILSRHDCTCMTVSAETFRAPDVLGAAGIDFRPPMGEELPLLGDWHAAFREELWGTPRSEERTSWR